MKIVLLVFLLLLASISTRHGIAAESPPFVHVCRDAGAGGYEAFPDVCRLSDGRLMCVFYAGYGHVSDPRASLPQGARIALCRSRDDGQTWSPAEVVADTPIDDREAARFVEQTRGGPQ